MSLKDAEEEEEDEEDESEIRAIPLLHILVIFFSRRVKEGRHGALQKDKSLIKVSSQDGLFEKRQGERRLFPFHKNVKYLRD